MNTTTIDLSTLTPEQLVELSKEVVAKTRAIKSEQKKAAKYAQFPMYQEYRQAVAEAFAATNKKKALLKQLKALGFGQKAPKATTPKVTKKKK
jgi:hypothetical protein